MPNLNHKILVLSSRKLLNYFLINKLSKKYNIVQVIYEDRSLKNKIKFIKNRIRKLGLIKTIGQLVFIFFDKTYINKISKPKIKQLLVNEDTTRPNLPSIDVDDINGAKAEELIKKINPEAIVVAGTSIIKSNILRSSKIFVNIHCGITPKYRGVHGGFWAIYNKDFDNIGVTVHLVDKGVDEGRILYQDRVKIDPKFDTFQTISAKQYLKGVDLMIRAVNDILNNNLRPFPWPNKESRQWYHPTIIEYIKWLKIFKSL